MPAVCVPALLHTVRATMPGAMLKAVLTCAAPGVLSKEATGGWTVHSAAANAHAWWLAHQLLGFTGGPAAPW